MTYKSFCAHDWVLGKSMIRFLLIHYLALSSALMPIVCCCTFPAKFGSKSNEGQSKQTAPESCCCHKQKSKTETSAPCQGPIENHRNGCPCHAGKLFLVYGGRAEQSVATRDLNLLDGFRAVALYPCYVMWDSSDLSLLSLSALRHNACCLSSVELLRAKCVLRC